MIRKFSIIVVLFLLTAVLGFTQAASVHPTSCGCQEGKPCPAAAVEAANEAAAAAARARAAANAANASAAEAAAAAEAASGAATRAKAAETANTANERAASAASAAEAARARAAEAAAEAERAKAAEADAARARAAEAASAATAEAERQRAAEAAATAAAEAARARAAESTTSTSTTSTPASRAAEAAAAAVAEAERQRAAEAAATAAAEAARAKAAEASGPSAADTASARAAEAANAAAAAENARAKAKADSLRTTLNGIESKSAAEEGEIPEGIRNNEYYQESLRLSKAAQDAYDKGLYDESAVNAEEAIKYAKLSDAYVTEQLIAEAKRHLDWADANNIQTRYPNIYNSGKAYYEESLAAQKKSELSKANVAAINAIEVLGSMAGERPAALPGQYTVRSWRNERDCLWNIAGYPFVYGDPWKWRLLYDANKSKLPNPNNPNVIEPGTVLDIPALPGETRSGMWTPNNR